MSQENEVEKSGDEAANVEDPIKQIKGEFARKTSNLEEKLAQTNAQLEAMIAEVMKANNKSTEPAKSSKSARDLLYDDPDQFVNSITEQAVKRARDEAASISASQSALQNTIVAFTQKYPEFTQSEHEAVALATKFGNELPKHLKGTPEGAELAMTKAVAELGLIPVSKRAKSTSDESAAVGGAKGSSGGSKASSNKLDDNTLAIAQLLGVDITDKKRVAGINKAKERKSWTRYE